MKPELTKKGKKLLLKGKLDIHESDGIHLVRFDSLALHRVKENSFKAYLYWGKKKIFEWDYLPQIDIGDTLHLSGIYESHIDIKLI